MKTRFVSFLLYFIVLLLAVLVEKSTCPMPRPGSFMGRQPYSRPNNPRGRPPTHRRPGHGQTPAGPIRNFIPAAPGLVQPAPLPGPDLALLQQPSNPIGLDNVLLGGVGRGRPPAHTTPGDGQTPAGSIRNLGAAAPNLVQPSNLPGPDLALLQPPSSPIGLDSVLLGGVRPGSPSSPGGTGDPSTRSPQPISPASPIAGPSRSPLPSSHASSIASPSRHLPSSSPISLITGPNGTPLSLSPISIVLSSFGTPQRSPLSASPKGSPLPSSPTSPVRSSVGSPPALSPISPFTGDSQGSPLPLSPTSPVPSSVWSPPTLSPISPLSAGPEGLPPILSPISLVAGPSRHGSSSSTDTDVSRQSPFPPMLSPPYDSPGRRSPGSPTNFPFVGNSPSQAGPASSPGTSSASSSPRTK
uniref:Ixodegrin B n=1 Tax=Rhipicephalus appendiculatus TaxID=34631 RepID=A0A131YC85_RHIAP